MSLCRPPPQLECKAEVQLFVREAQVPAARPEVLSRPVPRASGTYLCFFPDPLRGLGSRGHQAVSRLLAVGKRGSPFCPGFPKT